MRLLDGLADGPASIADDARLDDLMATLAHLTAESIGLAFDRFILPTLAVDQVYVSGGGVHNTTLIELLAERLSPIPVDSLLKAGMDPDAKEAIGFAVLALWVVPVEERYLSQILKDDYAAYCTRVRRWI